MKRLTTLFGITLICVVPLLATKYYIDPKDHRTFDPSKTGAIYVVPSFSLTITNNTDQELAVVALYAVRPSKDLLASMPNPWNFSKPSIAAGTTKTITFAKRGNARLDALEKVVIRMKKDDTYVDVKTYEKKELNQKKSVTITQKDI